MTVGDASTSSSPKGTSNAGSGIYEPETPAFGGKANMTAAQALFVTDGREIQQLRQRDDLTIGPRELSDLLCTIMMRAARLEW